jgi:hypothetical protein
MATLLCFPEMPRIRRDPHFRDLSEILNIVNQLQSFQKLVEAHLSGALVRLETALADLDALDGMLPAGDFKTKFDLDRSALATQLDLAKGKVIGLWEQTDIDRRARV